VRKILPAKLPLEKYKEIKELKKNEKGGRCREIRRCFQITIQMEVTENTILNAYLYCLGPSILKCDCSREQNIISP
jgi:hypothetical protein